MFEIRFSEFEAISDMQFSYIFHCASQSQPFSFERTDIALRGNTEKGSYINHVDSEGEGIIQMTILQFLVKVTTMGKGVKNTQKFDHMVYGWPLKNS